MSSRTPVLFIGHGAPMNAVRRNAFTAALRDLGARLPRPPAILSISAHWETDGSQVLSHPAPQKLNDFFGDHPDLRGLAYAAPGDPAAAARTCELIPGATLNPDRGLDHGTWSVAVHLYPLADVPIHQLSLDRTLAPADQYALGRRLQPLRDQGVMILATGNICHNLRQIDFDPLAPPLPWNVAFDADIAAALRANDHVRIVDHPRFFASLASVAVPTPEHFTPLLYALGATMPEDEMSFVYEGFEHAAISLRSVVWQ